MEANNAAPDRLDLVLKALPHLNGSQIKLFVALVGLGAHQNPITISIPRLSVASSICEPSLLGVVANLESLGLLRREKRPPKANRYEINLSALEKLPGRKLVLTNGTRKHADAVMKKLAVHEHFEDVFDIVAAELGDDLADPLDEGPAVRDEDEADHHSLPSARAAASNRNCVEVAPGSRCPTARAPR